MLDMFTNLTKAAVNLVVETPVALVADTITLGGSLTEKGEPYTVEALSKMLENLKKAGA